MSSGSRSASFAAAALAAAVLAAAQEPAKPSPKPSPSPAQDQPRRRARVVSDLAGFELLDAAQLADKPTVAGATRVLGAKAPAILAPRLARLHGARPTFAWRHEGRRFAFTLWDEEGNELHAAEVDGLAYTLPAAAPPLADGRTYLWSVRLADPPSAPAATAGVVVVTPDERKRIDAAIGAADPDPYRAGLARAEAFVKERVWYDALAAYSDLVARFPDRPEAYEGRATLLAQLPALAAEADADFARADALTSSRR